MVWMALCLIVSCDSATNDGDDVHVNATPRAALRADAVGCWVLSGMKDVSTPNLIRLDSLAAHPSYGYGRRVVQRLNNVGRVVLRDAEGFAPLDSWSADSASDNIRIAFNNGLYGSNWVLELPAGNIREHRIRGQSRAFGDVVPGPDYPDRVVMANRVECKTAVDSTTSD